MHWLHRSSALRVRYIRPIQNCNTLAVDELDHYEIDDDAEGSLFKPAASHSYAALARTHPHASPSRVVKCFSSHASHNNITCVSPVVRALYIHYV